VEPRGRRRPVGRVRAEPVRRQARLDLRVTNLSLPTLNWIRFPELQPAFALEELLAGAAAAGFGAVGLDDLTVAGRSADEVAGLLRLHDLTCSDVGVLRISDGNVPAQCESLATLGAATGTEICIAAIAARTDESVDDLRAGAAILAEAGIRVALEFVPYGGVRSLSEGIDICSDVGWDRCGLLVDTWHFFRGGELWPLLRSLSANQIALVHLNDAAEPVGDLVYDSRFLRMPPGEGTFPLAGFLELLDEIGYDGVVSLEVLSEALRSRPPAEGARDLFAAAHSALGPPRHVETV
jgi:sugar phosphate isomerase/epimerase